MIVNHRSIHAHVLFLQRTPAGYWFREVELVYETREPFTVTLVVADGGELVRWICARDLLAAGLREPSGEGDIHVAPGAGGAIVLLELRSPFGHAVLEALAEEVGEFLDRAYACVPRGEEKHWFDLEHELTRLIV